MERTIFNEHEGEPQWELLVVLGPRTRVERLPPRVSWTVGRTREADLWIDDPSVSRKHLLLHVGEDLWVEDAQSQNGTQLIAPPRAATGTAELSERRLTPGVRERLEDGASLRVGRAVLGARRVSSGPEARVVVGASPAIERVLALVERVAPLDLAVLFTGETGSGKEVFARRLHERSARSAGPFVPINCAALSPELFESELFGHERGSFTGALGTKRGLLEVAEGGTVFLDELGELPLAQQAKLLRVIEDRSVQRVGALVSRSLDVRFVAATHRDLARAVDAGHFRSDLYFRLNGFTVELPPLRERPADIEELAIHFSNERARVTGQPPYVFSPRALEALTRHPWPGNVRELKNVVERAMVLASDRTIDVSDLLLDRAERRVAEPPGVETSLRGARAEREKQRILEVLSEVAGNQTRAAEVLGVSRRTLVSRLKEYGIPRPRDRSGRDG